MTADAEASSWPDLRRRDAPRSRTTWRRAITVVLAEHGETWADVVACTLDDAGLDAEFDPSYGLVEGKPFGLWTKRRVYFPVCYDGAEFVASVPRDPSGPIDHIGENAVAGGLCSDAVWTETPS